MLGDEPGAVDRQHADPGGQRRGQRGRDRRAERRGDGRARRDAAAGHAAADPAGAADARAGRGADPGPAPAADPDDHLRRGAQRARGRAALSQAGVVRVRRLADAVPARDRPRRPVAAFARRHPWRVLAVVAVLGVAGAGLAPRLSVSAGTSALVGSGSASGRATTEMHSKFGDEAVYVLVRGDLARLVLTADLNRLLGLEGCLSGNVPAGAVPPGGVGGPCARLGAARPVRVVYGPGTFINSSVEELTKQLQGRTRERAAEADRAREAAVKLALSKGYSQAEAKQLGGQAEKLVYAQFAQELLSLNAKYGLNLTG